MTYGEIISQIKTPLNKGIASNSDRLSGRYIIKIALRKRARVLKQEQEKKTLKDRFSRQRIPCMELISVPKHECECLPLKVSCSNLRRTKKKIPMPVKDFLYSITSIDGNIVYSPTEFNDYRRYSRLKPLQSKPRYFISNEYGYIIGDDDKMFISVEGVFADPLEAEQASCETPDDGDPCLDATKTNFHLISDLEDAVILLTFEEIARTFQLGKEDNLNNAKSNNLDQEQEDVSTRNV